MRCYNYDNSEYKQQNCKTPRGKEVLTRENDLFDEADEIGLVELFGNDNSDIGTEEHLVEIPKILISQFDTIDFIIPILKRDHFSEFNNLFTPKMDHPEFMKHIILCTYHLKLLQIQGRIISNRGRMMKGASGKKSCSN
ncbi:hypothetical protein L484_025469 [Morus notabilis]|uniref:Uncharacterized protein n=1 Tax=Morus notabilis TaxID=981085 RepID=W9RNM2_9ROSA|nr:hypothetical protein L484_025469 [Morus notabilis]